MDVQIEQSFGHYEVYVNGEFFCTADTPEEAATEINDYYGMEV